MIEHDTGRESLPGEAESVPGGVPVAAPGAPVGPAPSTGTGAVEATRETSDTPRVNTSTPPSGPSGGAVVPAGGVNTLRAILLGGGSPRTPDDARMTAIERRLDTLSLQLAREPRTAGDPGSPVAPSTAPAQTPEQAARLAEIERRLEDHDARLDTANEATSAATRGGDVTLATLETLRQQVDALRGEHAAFAEQTAARLREADARCQLRQLRVRTVRHQELQRLRRQVYAPAGALSGSRTAVAPASAPVVAAATRPSEPLPPVWPVMLGGQQPAVLATPAFAPAPVARGNASPADERSRHAALRRDVDMDGARHALGGSLAGLMRSLATICVVSARMAGNDLRTFWAWLTHDRHAPGDGRERDPRQGPFSD